MSFLRKPPVHDFAAGQAASLAPAGVLPSSVLGEILRNATRGAHHAIDHHALLAPLVRQDLSLEHYGRVLRGFLWLYTPLQEALVLGIERAGGGFELADRVGWLRADLDRLGLAGELPPDPWQPPPMDNAERLVGALYVVEGSTLGGQVIARRIAASLGLTAQHGARFFNGWGEQTNARWSAFWRFADTLCEPAGHGAAAVAAVAFFDALRRGLDRSQEWRGGSCD